MENFADIEGPVRIGLMSLVLWILAILVLLAVAAGIMRHLIRRSSQKEEGIRTPRLSPLEVAMKRLQSLKKDYRQLKAEPFTVEVADIVRDYLEAALRIPAREQTSEEFLGALQERKDLPDVLYTQMPGFLEQCDRVKFARQSLQDDQRDELLETAGTVVRSTDEQLHEERAAAGTAGNSE